MVATLSATDKALLPLVRDFLSRTGLKLTHTSLLKEAKQALAEARAFPLALLLRSAPFPLSS